ncbi:MAG TPA: BrnT family toxin [Nevskiaceae bacterium]|nr:BrnT family toxin [Nevskiaceae bacterium]
MSWNQIRPSQERGKHCQGSPIVRCGGRVRFHHGLFWLDDRKDCGENRYSGQGFVDARLHALVFTETATGIRVISFRKANKREVRKYENAVKA